MWAIIQLNDTNEIRLNSDLEEDFEEEKMFFGYKTKKEAIEQVKEWKLLDKFEHKKFRYIIEKEEEI